MLFLMLLILAGLLVTIIIGWGGFLLAIKLGVIVNEASKPQYLDNNSYTLDQGRDVGVEQHSKR